MPRMFGPVLVAALVCNTGVAFAAPAQRKVAVMPLVAKRMAGDTIEILDELLVNGLHQSAKYQIVGGSDLNAMLGFEKMKEALGCDDVACAAEIGGALGVDMIVAGSVSKLGDMVIISAKLIDPKRAEVRSRAQIKLPDREQLFDRAVASVVRQLLGEAEFNESFAWDLPPSGPGGGSPAPERGGSPASDDSDAPQRRREPVFGLGLMAEICPTQEGQQSAFTGLRLMGRLFGPLWALLDFGYAAAGERPGNGDDGLAVGFGLEYKIWQLFDDSLVPFVRARYDRRLWLRFDNPNTAFTLFENAFNLGLGARFFRVLDLHLSLGSRYSQGLGYGLGASFGYQF